MSSKEISDGEKKFVEAELKKKNDELLFTDWVRKKKKGGKSFESRLLVISKYRVLSLKRGAMGGKSIQREGQIYNLKQVLMEGSQGASFIFAEFKFSFETDRLADAIKAIYKSVQMCYYDFPDSACPKIDAGNLVKIEKYRNPSHANGLIDIYRAKCNFLDIIPCKNLETYIIEICQRKETVLDLSNCPGLTTKEKTEATFDITPLLQALKYNTYFTAFVVKGVAHKELPSLIAATIEGNTVLTQLVLSNIDATKGFADIGNAMRNNSKNQISKIDFSHNKISDAAGLAVGISHTGKGLTEFDVSQCSLSGKDLAKLMEAFRSNDKMWCSMNELDLSGNEMDKNACAALIEFLQKASSVSSMEFLGLSNCQVYKIGDLMREISQSLKYSLIEIDISDNRITPVELSSLQLLFQNCQRIEKIKLAGTKLTEEMLDTILSTAHANPHLQERKLQFDVSRNELGGKKAVGTNLIQRSIADTSNLYGISLRDNKFKLKDYLDVVRAAIQSSHIKMIDIGCVNKVHMNQFMKSLVDLLSAPNGIEVLNLSGDIDGKNFWGNALLPLFDVIANHNTIRELNISHNKAGDRVLSQLCGAIKNNKSLRVLKWDNNEVKMGLELWSTFRDSLQVNKSLVDVELPLTDINHIVSQAKDKDKMKQRLKQIWDQIQNKLSSNAQLAGINSREWLKEATREQVRQSIMVSSANSSQFLDRVQAEARLIAEEQQNTPIPLPQETGKSAAKSDNDGFLEGFEEDDDEDKVASKIGFQQAPATQPRVAPRATTQSQYQPANAISYTNPSPSPSPSASPSFAQKEDEQEVEEDSEETQPQAQPQAPSQRIAFGVKAMPVGMNTIRRGRAGLKNTVAGPAAPGRGRGAPSPAAQPSSGPTSNAPPRGRGGFQRGLGVAKPPRPSSQPLAPQPAFEPVRNEDPSEEVEEETLQEVPPKFHLPPSTPAPPPPVVAQQQPQQQSQPPSADDLPQPRAPGLIGGRRALNTAQEQTTNEEKRMSVEKKAPPPVAKRANQPSQYHAAAQAAGNNSTTNNMGTQRRAPPVLNEKVTATATPAAPSPGSQEEKDESWRLSKAGEVDWDVEFGEQHYGTIVKKQSSFTGKMPGIEKPPPTSLPPKPTEQSSAPPAVAVRPNASSLSRGNPPGGKQPNRNSVTSTNNRGSSKLESVPVNEERRPGSYYEENQDCYDKNADDDDASDSFGGAPYEEFDQTGDAEYNEDDIDTDNIESYSYGEEEQPAPAQDEEEDEEIFVPRSKRRQKAANQRRPQRRPPPKNASAAFQTLYTNMPT